MIELSRGEARRLAVAGQLLDGPRPTDVLEVVEHLGRVQMDPTSAVAPSQLLVLWSRLGTYSVAELERLLWEERRLFEYWAYIVPTCDYGVHRETMRRYPRGERTRAVYMRGWLAENRTFRRYVLGKLRREGPLRSRDLEDRAVVPWRTGGWNDGKNLGRMLDLLWFRGEIMIVGRDGAQRIWDLAERRLPAAEPRLPQREVARRLVEGQLRSRGVARADDFGYAFDGAPPGRGRALLELVREGVAVPVGVEGLSGEWYAHRDLLERGPGEPRTTLLSPFDKVISNRERTEELFGFRFRLEIYVPKEKREYGYFVLPILHGDRLIGRIDPLMDRRSGRLTIHAVHAEPGAPGDAGPAVGAAIQELAAWLGATEVVYTGRVPAAWQPLD